MAHKKDLCISRQTTKRYYNKSYKCQTFDLVKTYIIFNLQISGVYHVYFPSKKYFLETPWTAILNHCFKISENWNHSRLFCITSYTVKSNLQTQNRRLYDFWMTENNAESQLGQMALSFLTHELIFKQEQNWKAHCLFKHFYVRHQYSQKPSSSWIGEKTF